MSFWCGDSDVSLLFMTLLLYSHFHSLRITPSVFSQVIPMTLWFFFLFFFFKTKVSVFQGARIWNIKSGENKDQVYGTGRYRDNISP